jgi:uncharacterized protein YciI
MFIINITYKVSLEQINAKMQVHVAYLDKYFASNKFLIAGRKKPRTGGIIVAIGDNKQEIETIAKEDPFYTNSLADIEVIEFSAGKKAGDIDALLADSFK